MRSKKQKYYVVWHGHRPGIYTTWEQCSAQVKNFPNAIYKSYETRKEADDAYLHGPEKKKKAPVLIPRNPAKGKSEIIYESISVDAACSGNPGMMEYRGVWTADKAELFHFGPARNGTNNIGEFLAIVHALALLRKKDDHTTPIYTDSKTALAWVKKRKANTKLEANQHNKQLFEMISRAEKWLKENQWKNNLMKWDTENWGEIPADFGRK